MADKPRIVLSGFFGRGNCGDEAILQVQYEALADAFDIIISVDQHGAYDGFWNWYPYDRCERIHHGDVGALARADVVGLHVGGGGLPYGFNGAQVVHAAAHGRPVLLTGTDLRHVDDPSGRRAAQRHLDLFDLIAPRSVAPSQRRLRLRGRLLRGHDWAFGLRSDASQDVGTEGCVVVVLREFPEAYLTAEYLRGVERLVDHLENHHQRPVRLLPFCPEDERFCAALDVSRRVPMDVHWWNPRRVQQILASATRVVSVGRLHPLVFAANVATPADFIEPLPGHPSWPATTKAQLWCEATGQAYAPSIDAFLDGTMDDAPRRARAAAFTPADEARWQAMVDAVRGELIRAAERRGFAP